MSTVAATLLLHCPYH